MFQVTTLDLNKIASDKKVDYTKEIPSEDVQKYCLEKGEILPLVRKPKA